MIVIRTTLFGIFLMIISSTSTFAQTRNLEQVKLEISMAITKEQNAFRNGDCEVVLSLMAEDITFLANGRKAPSKEMIGSFCYKIKRPFKKPLLDNLDIYALTNDSGYVIRSLEYPKNDTIKMQEYVTKIWKKVDGEWKITHLHSTVKEVAISK